ncbi:34343_t:CDS:1, partial [Racocetra persica]
MPKHAKQIQKTKNIFASLLARTATRVLTATTSYSERTTEIIEEPTSRDNISQQGD